MSDLNRAQEEAATTTSERAVVIASPGSGKTRTLVARIQFLLEQGVSPLDIVAITYTIAAGREIQSRIGGARLGHCGTIHSYALKLLTEHHQLLNLPPRIAVLDEEQVEELLKDWAAAMRCRDSIAKLKELARNWSWAESESLGKRANRTLSQLVVDSAYNRMLTSGALSYDAILAFAVALAQNHTTNLKPKHLLVDEYQDCSAMTHQLCTTLPAASRYFVGDPDQSIFGWIGGSPEFLVSESQQWERYDIEENYRSVPEVCHAAQNLIQNNRRRVAKAVVAARTDRGSFEFQQHATGAAEVAWLIRELSKADNPSECAVICRTNDLAESVAFGLEAAGISVAKDRPTDLPPDWRECKRLIALCESPDNDELAYWFICSTKGKTAADHARLFAADAFCSINQSALKIPTGLTPSDVLPFLGRYGISAAALAIVGRWIEQMPEAGLNDLLITLNATEGEARTSSPGVTVSTVHRAKGREWRAVYVVGCEEGHWPGRNADVEEERRVMFVAVTRAKDRCVVSWAMSRRTKWAKEDQPRQVSRFVAELGGS